MAFCTGCGRPAATCDGGCTGPYEPRRYCALCGRKAFVQVTPAGQRTRCRPHRDHALFVAGPNLSLDRTIWVDHLTPGAVHRSDRAEARGGGKGANVARAAASLGVEAKLAGVVAGRTGEAVAGLLADEGLDALTVVCPGETRACLTVLGPAGPTVFNEEGPELSDPRWSAYEQRVLGALPPRGILVVSGSFPRGVPGEAAARLVDAGRERGLFTVCDTSRAHLQAALASGPDLVKPNLAEALEVLGESTGEPVDFGPGALERAADAAAELCARGARRALVSAGSAGAALHAPEGRLRWRPPPVAVLNPVGAGDCLVAGFAAGLLGGAGIVEAAELGLAAAAAGCETFSAGELDPARAAVLRPVPTG